MTLRDEPLGMVGAVISRRRAGMPEVLIAKNPSAPYEGLWSFPVGPIDRGESPEAALRRSLRTQLGTSVRIVCGQPPFDQTYDDVLYRWRYFFCDGEGSQINKSDFAEIRWVPRGALTEYDLDPVTQKIADWLLEEE
jgi:8-oxo-dGTP diphosphatase